MHDGPKRAGKRTALLRVAQTAQPLTPSSLEERRRLVADLCRMLGQQAQRATDQPRIADGDSLSPRLAQTLDALLAGDSEKQIAQKLSISQHTVHVYVKALYKGFGVSSRGELLARFIQKPQARSNETRGAPPVAPRQRPFADTRARM